MSRLPVTATGLARLRPEEPEDMIVTTSEGQQLRLRPQGPRLSDEAVANLGRVRGAVAPPEETASLSLGVDPSTGTERRVDALTGQVVNPMNDPNQASNINALANQARRGDRAAQDRLKQIGDYVDREQRRQLSQQVATERQEITLQTQAARQEKARVDKFIDENRLPSEARAQAYAQIASQFPKAGRFLPDPSGYAFLEELKENQTLLSSEMMREQFKAFNGDQQAAARFEEYLAIRYPDKPEVARGFRDQINQEEKIRRDDRSTQMEVALKRARANSRFEYVPSSERIPFGHGSFDLKADNPYAKVKGMEKEAARFEQVRRRAEADFSAETDRILTEFGVADVDARPLETRQATDTLTAAIQRQAAEQGESLPGAPAENAFSTDAATRAVQEGRLLPGVPFTHENGKRYRYLSSTGTFEEVQ